MLPDEFRAYSLPTAVRISGASEHQVRYWAKTGLVSPSIDRSLNGQRVRLWSFPDLIELSVIVELRRRNRGLQQIRRVVDFVVTVMALHGRSPRSCFSWIAALVRWRGSASGEKSRVNAAPASC